MAGQPDRRRATLGRGKLGESQQYLGHRTAPRKTDSMEGWDTIPAKAVANSRTEVRYVDKPAGESAP